MGSGDRQQQEQIEELYDRQDPVEQTDMTDVYGCKSLYGTYDFPVEYNVAGLGERSSDRILLS